MRYRPRPANVHRIAASAFQSRLAYESHFAAPMPVGYRDAMRALVKALGFDAAKALIESQPKDVEPANA